MQKNVRNVGMQKAEGMLGGTFACSLKESNDFLVLSGWKSEIFHQRYTKIHFPRLIEFAKPKDDVRDLAGEKFRIEEAWRVLPTML